MHPRAFIAVAAVGCLVSACASEPPGPSGGGPPGGMPGPQLQEAKITRPVALLFTGMDANHDLLVTRAELDAAIDSEFARADADKSGAITGFEMADWCKAVLGDAAALPDLREMDPDMSYTVTPHEFATALHHEFERLDANGDGVMTRAEMLMDAPHMRMGPDGGGGAPSGGQRSGGGRGRGGGGGGRGGGGPGGGTPPF